MTIRVSTPDHGVLSFRNADAWGTDAGQLWVGDKTAGHRVASFAQGAWLHVYEVVEFVEPSPAVPKQWSEIRNVPPGVTVRDRDGDEFKWENGMLYYIGSPWGTPNASFDANLAPFTEVVK